MCYSVRLGVFGVCVCHFSDVKSLALSQLSGILSDSKAFSFFRQLNKAHMERCDTSSRPCADGLRVERMNAMTAREKCRQWFTVVVAVYSVKVDAACEPGGYEKMSRRSESYDFNCPACGYNHVITRLWNRAGYPAIFWQKFTCSNKDCRRDFEIFDYPVINVS